MFASFDKHIRTTTIMDIHGKVYRMVYRQIVERKEIQILETEHNCVILIMLMMCAMQC